MRKDFAVFILSHGRPDNIVTIKTLEKAGCKYPVYIIIDNEDRQADLYFDRYGDKVVMFDKKAWADRADEGDNFDKRQTILHARNACYEIAKELGYRYFVQLDDDYKAFEYYFDEYGFFAHKTCKGIDRIFTAMLDFFENSPFRVFSLAQDGDMLGGKHGSEAQQIRIKRKSMNSFFCDAERPVWFCGRFNEDVNTYTSKGQRGVLFGQTTQFGLVQGATQSNAGGITEAYKESGTFVKSFFTVMYSPSCVHIGVIGYKNIRLHHKVEWKYCVPKLLREKWRKAGKEQAKKQVR